MSLSASGDLLLVAKCRQTDLRLAMLRFVPDSDSQALPVCSKSRDSSQGCGLPRQRLSGAKKIEWESSAYQSLSESGLAPQVLFSDKHLIVNSWSPSGRLSELLRKDCRSVWLWMPVVLNAIALMHEQGIVHLDLNCGNILIDPSRRHAGLIDFEYQPLATNSLTISQAFDYVRFLHGLLQRRRGRDAILDDRDRFMGICRDQIPVELRSAAMDFPDAWLGRCLEISGFRSRM